MTQRSCLKLTPLLAFTASVFCGIVPAQEAAERITQDSFQTLNAWKLSAIRPAVVD